MKAMIGTLILLLVGAVVSCTRNLSVPVAALVNTATPTVTKTPTALASTATQTNTSTTGNTSTCTNTATVTNTDTPLGNTYTPTSTQTVTDTQTVTNTSTPQPPTSTATCTNTQTNTCTPTPTVLVPTATPTTYFDWDDFDYTGGWMTGSSTAANNYQSFPSFNSGASGTFVVPTAFGYNGTAQSFEINVTSWGAGTGPSAGYAICQFECSDPYDWDNVTQSTDTDTWQYNGGNVDVTTGYTGVSGSFTPSVLSIMIYSSGGPVTLADVYLRDGAGNEAEQSSLGFNCPNGQWTNFTVQVSSATGWTAVGGVGMGTSGSGQGILYDNGSGTAPSQGGGWTKLTQVSPVFIGQPSGAAQIYIDSIYFY